LAEELSTSRMSLSKWATTAKITKGEKVGSIKDFGADPYIWNESFDNYISICSILYFPQFPQMAPAMLNFRKKMVELSRIYAWSCVL